MAVTVTKAPILRAITSCVPSRCFDNLAETTVFEREEVEKVVKMAGVKTRHLAADNECSSDLCVAAAQDVLRSLQWDPSSVDALIMVTQSPDYFLPSTACIVQRRLGLSDACAAFDVGLGCSGYPYGLWLAAMMLQCHGFRRVLVLHGETPTRFSDKGDRAVALLFGDAGSATALEAGPADASSASKWWFCLHTDGSDHVCLTRTQPTWKRLKKHALQLLLIDQSIFSAKLKGKPIDNPASDCQQNNQWN